MVYENILVEVEDGIALLKINRPKVLNALNKATLLEIQQALRELTEREDVRGLIITGEGEKAFVAGADVAEMAEMTPQEAQEFSRLGHETLKMIEEFPWPVIAAVNGYALGGGLEVALACDLIFASEGARLGLPEVTLGIFPGFGGTQRLPRLIGRARALEVILTGQMFEAQRAYEMGMVNRVCPADRLLEEAKEVARQMAKNGPIAVKMAKKVVKEGLDSTLREGEELEIEAWANLFSTHDQKEGMKAFLEKRKPSFRGE
ncbi:MAG: enoyl-CoA hydratase/isomerase family protein [Deltaproteobacteria bacterium]|nr:MAG: enoyl-CoA hydratase/isomerase family protein [Deltaproteobacteria bacterium]HEX15710.1 enoyl-CoA hydratase/isomerase family protein [Deltaproteobacteria bacterium]